MQHFMQQLEQRLGQYWSGMLFVRHELCSDRFEQPKIALCGGTVA